VGQSEFINQSVVSCALNMAIGGGEKKKEEEEEER
jgi:hypothetical protein